MLNSIQTLWGQGTSPEVCCYFQVTRAVFEASKGRLKVVGRAGVGIDNVDLQAATEVGCLTSPVSRSSNVVHSWLSSGLVVGLRCDVHCVHSPWSLCFLACATVSTDVTLLARCTSSNHFRSKQ